MGPFHGDFYDFELQLAGEIEEFRIKTPAFNFLQGKDLAGGIAGKCLEAALGILETKAQGDAQHQIKYASENLPVEGLALRLQIAAQPARADGNVRAAGDGAEELVRFLDGRRKIGIAEQQQFAFGM